MNAMHTARRNLFMAVGAAVCAPVATELLWPQAASAATLRDMTAGEQRAFTAAMESLFNEGFDTPRPDRFVRFPLDLFYLIPENWCYTPRKQEKGNNPIPAGHFEISKYGAQYWRMHAVSILLRI